MKNKLGERKATYGVKFRRALSIILCTKIHTIKFSSRLKATVLVKFCFPFQAEECGLVVSLLAEAAATWLK